MVRKKKAARPFELSPREPAVLKHLARGERLPDIAKPLGLSVNTLHTFLRRTQKKLKAETRWQAAVIAARLRLF